MAGISRSQLAKELEPGLNALYGLEYKRYDEQHKDIYDVEGSERAWEEEQKISGFGAAQGKEEGAGVAYDTAQEVYTARYVHETVALAYSITEEAIEDNLYDSLSTRYTKALARAMSYTKQVKAAALLNNAFNAAVKYGDGKELCALNRPTIQGATNSNTAATPVDLNETSLEAAIIQLSAWVDERGLLIAAKPRKLIIPPSLQFTVSRLLDTDKRVGTSDNDINALRNNGSIPDGFAVNNFLTDPDAWFLKTDVSNGMKHFNRVKMTTKTEVDFNTGNIMYKVRERYSFGCSDPLGMWGSAGA